MWLEEAVMIDWTLKEENVNHLVNMDESLSIEDDFRYTHLHSINTRQKYNPYTIKVDLNSILFLSRIY